MAVTPRNGLEQMGPSTVDHPTKYTDTMNRLDNLVNPLVLDRDLTAPPGSPTNGDTYIPAATATGLWVGQENNIAHYWDGWVFTTPVDGFRMFVADEHAVIFHNGAAWSTLGALISMADDTAVPLVPPDSFGMITIAVEDETGAGVMSFDTVGGTTNSVGAATNFNVANGVLAGTTGTDAKFTASCHTDGNVYLENRLGATLDVRYSFLGMP